MIFEMKSATQIRFNTIPKNQNIADLLNSEARQEMVEFCGRLSQLLGLPRSTGQIYGLFYFSSIPLSLGRYVKYLGFQKQVLALARVN